MVHDLQHTLRSRQKIMGNAHPSIWEHMTILAITLHKISDHFAAQKGMQQVVESQASVLVNEDAQLLYSQQYLAHLAFSCNAPQPSQLKLLQECQLVTMQDSVGARAVAGRNLLVHLQDHAAAVRCLLPVFQRWCIASVPPTRCQATESCLHMLVTALLELSLLEEFELVALAVLQKMGAQQDCRTLAECTSDAHLICLAVHNFDFYDVAPTNLARSTHSGGDSHLPHYAWQLLAKAYLKAGLLLEASAASSKAGHDVDSLLIKANVLFQAGNQVYVLHPLLHGSSTV